MNGIQIAMINESTVVANDDVTTTAAALQKQVTEHFYPAWGIDATIKVFASAAVVPAGYWWLVILDDSDQAGALGYHDVTPEGLPLGKVFARSDQTYGMKWTVTASHELLEMLGDPDINLSALVQTANTSGTLYAYEVCDACEDDSLGYDIDGVTVSDFVYPTWFESFRQPNSGQFDYQKRITRPFQLLSGGYIGVFEISAGSGWKQITADMGRHYRQRPQPGSRRERRRTPREHWMVSIPKVPSPA